MSAEVPLARDTRALVLVRGHGDIYKWANAGCASAMHQNPRAAATFLCSLSGSSDESRLHDHKWRRI
jgi:hypothetical protein